MPCHDAAEACTAQMAPSRNGACTHELHATLCAWFVRQLHLGKQHGWFGGTRELETWAPDRRGGKGAGEKPPSRQVWQQLPRGMVSAHRGLCSTPGGSRKWVCMLLKTAGCKVLWAPMAAGGYAAPALSDDPQLTLRREVQIPSS